MKKQSGFTLIELIMVIVILGVLSAFALPRFADLGGDARAASISGLAAAVRAASNIAHAQQLADGAAAGVSVSLEGQTITMVSGYPTANTAGIGAAAQISSSTTATADGTDFVATAGGATATSAITFSIRGVGDGDGDSTSGECSVTYTSTANAPTVTVNVDDC